MCLSIYAYKCDVPKAMLRADMKTAFERLRLVEHDNILSESDIESALEAYDREYFNFTISDIEALTEVRIDRNKRNGRKQEQHCEVMRAIQNVVNPGWRDGNGRPQGSGTAQQKVFQWRQAHPGGRKIDCERDTGLSRPTVLKWWDKKA
jgi:hypothetical protein